MQYPQDGEGSIVRHDARARCRPRRACPPVALAPLAISRVLGRVTLRGWSMSKSRSPRPELWLIVDVAKAA
jgi:hypothetical protein